VVCMILDVFISGNFCVILVYVRQFGTLRSKKSVSVVFLVTGKWQDIICDVSDDSDIDYLVLCCFSQIMLMVHPC
jgi:hypothetical protein